MVRENRQLDTPPPSWKKAHLRSVGNRRAYAQRGVETLQTSSGGAHTLAQNPLRHEFQRHFLGGEAFQKIIGVGPGKSSNHVLDLIVLEHDSKLAITRPTVVADGNNVLRAFPRQSLNESIR